MFDKVALMKLFIPFTGLTSFFQNISKEAESLTTNVALVKTHWRTQKITMITRQF